MKICLFARYPQIGKVKSRLAAECDESKALFYYKKMLVRVLENLSVFHKNLVVYYTGCDATTAKGWLPDFKLAEQASGNLGDKLRAALNEQYGNNSQKIAFIGADCIELTDKILKQTEKYLNDVDVVIGPSTDGGYYLLGLSVKNESLFDDINWGSEVVFEQTMNKIYEHNLSYRLLPQLSDIDYWKDLPEDWRQESEKLYA